MPTAAKRAAHQYNNAPEPVRRAQDALHPTPAVCGQPQGDALRAIREREPFDRGFYAGPFGWLSGSCAEFVVGIRSALVKSGHTPRAPPRAASAAPVLAPALKQAHDVFVYAGVGLVRGSSAASEWDELDLKVRQLRRALASPLPLAAQPNGSARGAAMLVEELTRCGVTTFAVAPGSRSSPLAHAAYCHPRVACQVCLDERSLGFWALGCAAALGDVVAVITTSGTAVANLLPAVIEASMSRVPLLLLTADRPPELRHAGANQTIDQVKLFGAYVRYAEDLPPPDSGAPCAAMLTSVDAAVRHARCASSAGPVHLNLQLREPLAPVSAPSPFVGASARVAAWEAGAAPYTGHDPITGRAGGDPAALDAALHRASPVHAALASAQRGVVVAGELSCAAERVAVLRLARHLGWPIVADVLSGLRVGGSAAGPAGDGPAVVHHMDVLLTDARLAQLLQPDCVVRVGRSLVSKRVSRMLASAAEQADMLASVIAVDAAPDRRDEHHCVAALLQCSCCALAAALPRHFPRAESVSDYAALLLALDDAAAQALRSVTQTSIVEDAGSDAPGTPVTEPLLAMVLGQHLPEGHGLFVGNSMPVRSLDMFAAARHEGPAGGSAIGHPVRGNRGASGIDGVVSAAAGFAAGLQRPTSLVVGDVSFIHDTNGLFFLQGQSQSNVPLTVVLINNSGGGIFDFLPVKGAVDAGK